MSDRLFENVVTLRIVSDRPIPPDTHIADLSFLVCTHVVALVDKKTRSRQMSAAETAAVDPTARAMIGTDPDPTRCDDPAAAAIAEVSQLLTHELDGKERA